MGRKRKKIDRTFKVRSMESKVKVNVDTGIMTVKVEAKGILTKKSGETKKLDFKIKNNIPLSPDYQLSDIQTIADNHKIALLEAYAFSELRADTIYDTKV